METRNMLASALTAVVLVCMLQVSASKGLKKTQELRTRAGHSIRKFVPPSLLQDGETVHILTAHYRLVGLAEDVERALSSLEILEGAFANLYERANYVVKISKLRLSHGIQPEQDEDGSRGNSEACYKVAAKRQKGPVDTAGIDVDLTIGVTRDTLHIDMGTPEWAYSKIVQTILQQHGFDLMVMVAYLTPAKSRKAVDILAHVPCTAIYAEETVLMLTGLSSSASSFLPFDSVKQNLLVKVIDTLGLHSVGGFTRINITRVQQSCGFTAGAGHKGIAKVTVVSQRDKPHILFPHAIMAVSGKLLEGLAEGGVHLEAVDILSSRPADHLSLQTQIASMLEKDYAVRSYESRVPADQLPKFNTGDAESSWADPRWSPASVVAALTCVAGYMLVKRLTGKKNTKPLARGVVQEKGSMNLPNAYQKGAFKQTPSMQQPGSHWNAIDTANAFADYLDQPFAHASPFATAAPSPLPAGSDTPSSQEAWHSPCLLKLDERAPSEWESEEHSLSSSAEVLPQPLSTDEARKQKSLERLDSLQGWRIREADIQICKRSDGSDWLLGEGTYGKVYKGIRDGLQHVACKVLHAGDELREQQFAMEIKLQKGLSFDNNVVQFLGATFHKGRPMLILEYMEGGDLSKALHRPGSSFSWRGQGRNIALDVVRGLAFLHKHSVLHGDLKSHNVLLGRQAGYAKLGDVGMSRIISSRINSQSMSPDGIAGTFSSAAPELLLGLKCSAKADIFSLGVLLWEIVTLEVPKRGRMREIRVPEECPEEIKALIDRCMTYDPRLRPTCQQVFECIERSNHAEQAAQL